MEWDTIESGKYRIESLSAATIPDALKIVKESFCKDEAVCIGTEVNKNPQAAEELLELCADAALDGASLVAIEVESGDVAAVSFNKLQVAATNSSEKTFFEYFAEERCSQESSRALIEFMANVDGRCNLFEKYGAECSLEIMFLSTLSKHRCNKLGTLLCKYSIELAKKLKDGPVTKITVKDLGPEYAEMQDREVTTKCPDMCQAIWTAEQSRRIGKNLKFNVHLKANFKEFVYKGKTFADRLGSELSFCEVAALSLRN